MKAEPLPRLTEFTVESNRIEGIGGPPKMEPSYAFLSLAEPGLEDLCEFVRGEVGAARKRHCGRAMQRTSLKSRRMTTGPPRSARTRGPDSAAAVSEAKEASAGWTDVQSVVAADGV